MKKFLLSLVAIVLTMVGANAKTALFYATASPTVTADASEQLTGTVAGQAFSTGGVNLKFTKVNASNSQVNSNLVRFYANDLITITPANSGDVIKKITIACSTTSYTKLALNSPSSGLSTAGTTVTFTSVEGVAEVVLKATAQSRFSYVLVEYASSATPVTINVPTETVNVAKDATVTLDNISWTPNNVPAAELNFELTEATSATGLDYKWNDEDGNLTLTGKTVGDYKVKVYVDSEIQSVKYKGEAYFNVHVYDPADNTLKITVDGLTDGVYTLVEGDSFTPAVTVTNANATGLDYALSFDGVGLTISDDGKTITADIPSDDPYTVTVIASGTINGKTVTETATFYVKVTEKPQARVFQKLTSLDDIEEGADVLIVCESKNDALGNQNSHNRGIVNFNSDELNINDKTITLSQDRESAFYVLEMRKNPDGDGYSFKDIKTTPNGYLSNNNSSNNYLKLDNNPVYPTVSIESGNANIKFGVESGSRSLKHNSNSALYGTYTTNQIPVQIYYDPKTVIGKDPYEMKITAENITDLGVRQVREKVNNVTFSKSLADYDEVTLSYTPEVAGNIEISNVNNADGTYTIKGVKANTTTKVNVSFVGEKNGKTYPKTASFTVTVGADPYAMTITPESAEVNVDYKGTATSKINFDKELSLYTVSKDIKFSGYDASLLSIVKSAENFGEFTVTSKDGSADIELPVTVTFTGKVEGIDTPFTATATFKVIVGTDPHSEVMTIKAKDREFYKGDEHEIEILINPGIITEGENKNATYEISWISQDENITVAEGLTIGEETLSSVGHDTKLTFNVTGKKVDCYFGTITVKHADNDEVWASKTFAINIIPQPVSYIKVLDLKELHKGANVILTYAEKKWVMGEIQGKNAYADKIDAADKFYDDIRTVADSLASDKKTSLYNVLFMYEDQDQSQDEREENASKGIYRYSFKDISTGKYLSTKDPSSSSSKNLDLTMSDEETFWTVSLDENKNVKIQRPYNSSLNTLRVNTNQNQERFKTYSTGTGDLPQLYMEPNSIIPDSPDDVTIIADDIEVEYDTPTVLDNIQFTPGLENYNPVEGKTETVTFDLKHDEGQYGNDEIVIAKNDEGQWTVTGKKHGLYSIIVRFEGEKDGVIYKAKNTFDVTVKRNPNELQLEVEDVIVEKGKTAPIKVTYHPALAEGVTATLEYTFEDNEYFLIDNDEVEGYEITPEDVTVTVTATTSDDAVSQPVTFKVKVVRPNIEYLKVKDLKSDLGKKARVIIAATDPNTASATEKQKWVMSATGSGDNKYKNHIIATDKFIAEGEDANAKVLQTYADNYGVYEVTRTKNGYTFQELDADGKAVGYLTSNGNTSLFTAAAPAYWTLAISDKEVTTMEKGGSYIKANASSPRFTTYGSGQKDITLYVDPSSREDLTDVTLAWYCWDDEAESVAAGTEMVKELYYSEESLATGPFDLELKAFDKSNNKVAFDINNVKVTVTPPAGKRGSWENGEFKYSSKGDYLVNVAENSAADLSAYNLTLPEELKITVNPLKSGLKAINLQIDHKPTVCDHVVKEGVTPDAKSEVELNENHGLETYVISLNDGDKYADDDVFIADDKYAELFEATIVPKFDPNEIWNEEKHHFNDMTHIDFHHLYYAAPVVGDFDSKELLFEASMAGLYELQIKVVDGFGLEDWFDVTEVSMPLEITPVHEVANNDGIWKTLFDIDKAVFEKEGENWVIKHTVQESDFPTLLKQEYPEMSEEAIINLCQNNIAEARKLITDKIDKEHGYFGNCRFVFGAPGKLYYRINGGTSQARRYAPATQADEPSLEEQGYKLAEPDTYGTHSKNNIDLRGLNTLNVVQEVNGIRTPVFSATGSGNVETSVEEIEAAEMEYDADTIFFTIDGIRVKAPLAPGLYIRKEGGKAGLIMVR